MNKVYYFVPRSDANGVKVITQNLVNALKRRGITCVVTESLPEEKTQLVIPGGVKNGVRLIQDGVNTSSIILGDAITLGYKNKIKFYIKERHFFNKDFFYSLYGYFRYKREEKLVVEHYDRIVLFSPVDIEYLKSLSGNSSCKYICIPNGANLQEPIAYKRSNNNKVRVGILSAWGDYQAFEENNWFIKKYWVKFHESHPEFELVLAGRGSQLNKIKNNHGITVLGEVSELSDFFESIDFFLTVNPKGCGILNRVLDAMAYRVPIIGIDASFSGFPDSDSIFVKFSDYKSFVSVMEYVAKPETNLSGMVEAAYDYLLVNNNWEKNYDRLVEFIINE